MSRLFRILLVIKSPLTFRAVRVSLVWMRARVVTHPAISRLRNLPMTLSCLRASCGQWLRLWTRSLRRGSRCWGWFMASNLNLWQVIVRGLPRKPLPWTRESSTKWLGSRKSWRAWLRSSRPLLRETIWKVSVWGGVETSGFLKIWISN